MTYRYITSNETKKRLQGEEDLVVSVSGGKDSTATCLRLFEMGYSKDDFKRVFYDTGWEYESTYKYLDELEKHVGKIERRKYNLPLKNFTDKEQHFILEIEDDLGMKESPFVRLAVKWQMFPTFGMKFCTRHLKLHTFKKWLDEQDNDFISIVGVRRAESKARSEVLEWEWNNKLDTWVWRPIFLWTEQDVIDIHHKFGIIPNHLYLKGYNRVSCYPCIYSNKDQIRKLESNRVEIIDKMERWFGRVYREKIESDPKYREKNEKGVARLDEGREKFGYDFRPFFKKHIYLPIKELQEWSKTTTGGKQYKLFHDVGEPTCAKWGLCNAFSNDNS